jgi:hypothetical protein
MHDESDIFSVGSMQGVSRSFAYLHPRPFSQDARGLVHRSTQSVNINLVEVREEIPELSHNQTNRQELSTNAIALWELAVRTAALLPAPITRKRRDQDSDANLAWKWNGILWAVLEVNRGIFLRTCPGAVRESSVRFPDWDQESL